MKIVFTDEEKQIISTLNKNKEFKSIFRKGVRKYTMSVPAALWIREKLSPDVEITDELLQKLVQSCHRKKQ